MDILLGELQSNQRSDNDSMPEISLQSISELLLSLIMKLESLPNEILLKIFSYCQINFKYNSRLTSIAIQRRYWYLKDLEVYDSVTNIPVLICNTQTFTPSDWLLISKLNVEILVTNMTYAICIPHRHLVLTGNHVFNRHEGFVYLIQLRTTVTLRGTLTIRVDPTDVSILLSIIKTKLPGCYSIVTNNSLIITHGQVRSVITLPARFYFDNQDITQIMMKAFTEQEPEYELYKIYIQDLNSRECFIVNPDVTRMRHTTRICIENSTKLYQGVFCPRIIALVITHICDIYACCPNMKHLYVRSSLSHTQIKSLFISYDSLETIYSDNLTVHRDFYINSE